MRASIRKTGGNIPEDLRRMAQNISSLDDVLNEIGNLVFSIMQEAFAEGRSPDGRNWEALSRSTISLKIKYGFPAEPLVRSGRLKNGVLVEIEDKGSVKISFSPELERIARFHQMGTKHAPARPLVSALSPEDAQRLKEIITKHIERGVEGVKGE